MGGLWGKETRPKQEVRGWEWLPGKLGAMLASKHAHPRCVPQTLCSAASRIRATEGGSVGWCPRPRQPCVWDRCVCLVWRVDRGQGAPLPHLLHQPGFFPGLEIGMAMPLGHTERLFGGFVFISLGSVGWKDGLAWQLPPGRTVGWPGSCPQEDCGMAKRINVCFKRNQVGQKGSQAACGKGRAAPASSPLLVRAGSAQCVGGEGPAASL